MFIMDILVLSILSTTVSTTLSHGMEGCDPRSFQHKGQKGPTATGWSWNVKDLVNITPQTKVPSNFEETPE